VQREPAAQPAEQLADELVDAGRVLVGHVAHAEPPADVDDRRRPVEFGPARGRKGGEPVDGHAGCRRVEQLRPDVDVQPGDVEAGLARPPDGLAGGGGWETELRAVMAGPDGLVRVCLDPGRHAHEHAADTGAGGALDLVERVEHDEPGPSLRGSLKLVVVLVVAVDDQALAGNARAPREHELAEGRGVRAEPLLREEP
jgi:poly-gamma-glutamate capsule biosynthesis protein CapA/YwtB (metallophosphatase superfamily)